jgi:hypothetical protein
MKRIAYFLFILTVAATTLGCPTRRYIPDPVPPAPQASMNERNVKGSII